MKKIRNSFVLSMGILLANAQPYMELEFNHTGTFCSGIQTKNTGVPGFIMAGFHPTNLTSSPNFYIERIHSSGNAMTSFMKDYKIFRSSNCGQTSTATQALDCAGVTVIEAVASQHPFALVGAVTEGCFYASLDITGAPMSQMFYTFPAGANSPTKPFIVENPAVSQGFVICGSFSLQGQGRKMYVISIDKVGAVQFSNLYQCNLPSGPGNNYACPTPYGRELIPNAMIVSPYLQPNNAQSLVIVGEATYFFTGSCPLSGLVPPNSSAFFSLLNLSNLGWIDNVIYDFQGSPPISQYNRFNAIAVSNSINQGFTIGGYSEFNTAGGSRSWLAKIDPVGNLISSKIITSSYDPVSTDITGVVERYSALYGRTTYATARSATGMLCYRLNGTLNSFTAVASIDDKNEFKYASGVSPAIAEAISFDDASPSPGWGQGIHLYGNEPGTGNFFVEAAFNGYTDWTNCTGSSTNNQLSVSAGPQNANHSVRNTFQGLSACPNFYLVATNAMVTRNKLCQVSSLPAGGSNNRMMGMDAESKGNSAFSIYPNPASHTAKLILGDQTGEELSVKLLNSLGQLVSELSSATIQSNEMEIKLDDLNLKDGIYFIEVRSTGTIQRQKMVYCHE